MTYYDTPAPNQYLGWLVNTSDQIYQLIATYCFPLFLLFPLGIGKWSIICTYSLDAKQQGVNEGVYV